MHNSLKLILVLVSFVFSSLSYSEDYDVRNQIRFAEVDSTLFRSSMIHYESREEIDFLHLMGISEVIDLTSESEIRSTDARSALSRVGINYKKIDVLAKRSGQDKKNFSNIYQNTISYIASLKNKKVLVHCFFGRDRTGDFVDSYLKTKYRLPYYYRKLYQQTMTSWVVGSNSYHFFTDLPKQNCITWKQYQFCPRIADNKFPNNLALTYYNSLVKEFDQNKAQEYRSKPLERKQEVVDNNPLWCFELGQERFLNCLLDKTRSNGSSNSYVFKPEHSFELVCDTTNLNRMDGGRINGIFYSGKYQAKQGPYSSMSNSYNHLISVGIAKWNSRYFGLQFSNFAAPKPIGYDKSDSFPLNYGIQSPNLVFYLTPSFDEMKELDPPSTFSIVDITLPIDLGQVKMSFQQNCLANRINRDLSYDHCLQAMIDISNYNKSTLKAQILLGQTGEGEDKYNLPTVTRKIGIAECSLKHKVIR